jgi:hypothetical protein
MSVVIENFLVCDKCGNNFGVDTRGCRTVKKLRKDAIANGWKSRYKKYQGILDYCD